ncbi:MAG: hypothetical protein JNM70_11155 [Anaerolineae bacterium]|nr:hypothetical protein [Anaerolineae bacterium]
MNLRALLRVVRGLLAWGIRLAVMLALLQYSSYPLGLRWNAVAVLASDYQFDYVTWELGAVAVKAEQTLYGLHPFMSEAARADLVRAYMNDLAEAQRLDGQISAIYADPAQSDPFAASADLRAQRDALRADLETRQPLVESILEGQVAAVLVEQGFSQLGQILPPVSAHFTRVPNLLVVSPRDQIRFDVSINLNPLSTDQMAALEARIDAEQKVSSLIVPLGGIALYPAMVLETASIPAALDTIAHEWLHHYLFFFPLGLSYFSGDGFAGETRIINETTAALFGQEVGRLALAKFYPDLAVSGGGRPVLLRFPSQAQAFDFNREMDTTRRQVDVLLAEGKVVEAEAYMEERRRLFVENGYVIRKLNQAFFAFYGGYQAGGTAGAGGSDPIGPAVLALRQASPSLHDWIVTLRGITTREQLLAAADLIQ